MGIEIQARGPDVKVYGRGGCLQPCETPIYLEKSGTSMRLLTGVSSMGSGTYTLTGSDRMQMRPIKDLTDALQQIGIQAGSTKDNDCPPIEINAGTIDRSHVSINCQDSSQYLSALLLIAPLTTDGLDIQVVGGPVSRPYIDLTVALMETFGIRIERQEYRKFSVAGRQHYRAGRYTVEADCSRQHRYRPGRCALCRPAATDGVPGVQGFGRYLSYRRAAESHRGRFVRYARSGADAGRGGRLFRRDDRD